MNGTFFVLNNVPYPGRNACGDTMAFRFEFHKFLGLMGITITRLLSNLLPIYAYSVSVLKFYFHLG